MANDHDEQKPSASLALLLEIVRCPKCAGDSTKGILDPVREHTWLVCRDCDRKYPVPEDIPVLLVGEGTKWQHTAVADLPVPPPSPE